MSKRPYPASASSQLDENETICFHIPLNITADLILILRNYKSQKQKEQKLFKKLKTSNSGGTKKKERDKSKEEKEGDDESMDLGNDGDVEEDDVSMDGHGNSNGVVNRNDYNSVIDYLEAKYSRGVTVTNEIITDDHSDGNKASKKSSRKGVGVDNDKEEEDDEGSYYSDNDENDKFLDDTDLVTSVAEQVFASSAKTKIEIEAAAMKEQNSIDDDNDAGHIETDSDAAFFVNFGDIELVDDDENDEDKNVSNNKSSSNGVGGAGWFVSGAHEEYEEEKKRLQQKKVKPKKKSAVSSIKTAGSGGVNDSSKKNKKRNTETKTVDAMGTSSPIAKNSEETSKSRKSDEKIKALLVRKDNLKIDLDDLEKLAKEKIAEISNTHLPRKPTTFKTPMPVPNGKKSGDKVQFENPRIPGQTLQITIPESWRPGSDVEVTCPCPKGEFEEYDSSLISNQIPKRVRELLDVYGRVHDEWVNAEAEYQDAIGGETIKPHLERMKKFDTILKFFPDDLIIPIDTKFLRDKIKQLRQNRQKRNKWLIETNRENEIEELNKWDFLPRSTGNVTNEKNDQKVQKVVRIKVPHHGTKFEQKLFFDVNDFMKKE